MTKRLHVYKGLEIRNVPQHARPAFYILDEKGVALTRAATLRSAKWLIDVWTESRVCACGAERRLHDHRCDRCILSGRTA